MSKWAKDSPTRGIAAAAVLGGTASALGGGKFANGAASGAFTYLFNQIAHGKFSVAERSSLVLYSSSEQRTAGNGRLFADDMQGLGAYSKGKSLAVDLDDWDQETDFGSFLKSKIGELKFDNLVLCAHGGEDGICNAMLRDFYDPQGTSGRNFLTSVKPFLTSSTGSIRFYNCHDGIPSSTLKGIATLFGKPVYSQNANEEMVAHGYTIYPLARGEDGKLYEGYWNVTKP